MNLIQGIITVTHSLRLSALVKKAKQPGLRLIRVASNDLSGKQ
jgi:hypothetical protein